jgi:hypothetical protein
MHVVMVKPKAKRKVESKSSKKVEAGNAIAVESKRIARGWDSLPQAVQANVLTFLPLGAAAQVGPTSRASATLVSLPRADYFRSDRIVWNFNHGGRSIEEFKLFWTKLTERLPRHGELKGGEKGVGLTLLNVTPDIARETPPDALPHIVSLKIWFMGQDEVAALTKWLGRLSNLESLSIGGRALGAAGLAIVLDALSPDAKAAITTLSMEDTGLTAQNAMNLSPVLGLLLNLRDLDLSYNRGLGATGAAILLSGLADVAKACLTILDLTATGLVAFESEELFRVLPIFQGLRSLNLSGNRGLGATGVVYLLSGLADEARVAITTLSLGSTGLTTEDSLLFAKSKTFPALKHLTLCLNDLGAAGVITILRALLIGEHPAIAELYLEETGLNDKNIGELTSGLKLAPSLRRIHLNLNIGLGIVGLNILARALKAEIYADHRFGFVVNGTD